MSQLLFYQKTGTAWDMCDSGFEPDCMYHHIIKYVFMLTTVCCYTGLWP